MGIAVFAGMLGVTLFGLFLTPLFYVLVEGAAARIRTWRRPTVLPQPERTPLEGL